MPHELAEGACVGATIDFYAETESGIRKAKQVCGRCPVRDVCFTWAQESREEYGVWGGFSADERRQLRGEPLPEHGTLARYRAGCRLRCCIDAKAREQRRAKPGTQMTFGVSA